MEKLRRDVFRYGEILDKPSGRALVLVHPWFCGVSSEGYELQSFGACIFSEGNNYLDNLEKLIYASIDKNVILFEEFPKYNVDAVSKRLVGIRGTYRGLYTVSTKSMDNSPKYSSWNVALDFLPDLSNGVDIVGGYVYGKDYEDGCAGDTLLKMKERGIDVRFVRGCCFK